MIPGKVYSPAELLAIALRRKWQILIPALIVTSGAAVAVQFVPNRYRSEALIQVTPQRIPEEYVRSTVTARIEERLQSIRQALLSRSTLERLIRELGLYERELREVPMEVVVATIRSRDIDIALDENEAFRVRFEADDAFTAQKVAARLTSLLIEENTKDRQGLASDTSEFLDEELRKAERRLAEQEHQLATFRSENAGELPDQLPSIMQAIQNRQLQVQTLSESLTRDRSEKLLLERQRADLAAASSLELSASTPGNAGNVETRPASTQLEIARAELQRLEVSRKPDHPDVQALLRRIEALERKAKEEDETATNTSKPVTAAEINRGNRLKEVDAQILNLERQIAAREQMRDSLEAEIRSYQTKAEAVPLRESQLSALTRGYATLQQTYQGLLRKRDDSQIAANLELRRAGEQFNILDPAGFPERPYSPNRPLILLLGLAAGLAAGVGLAGVLEYRDVGLRTEADVIATLAIPVLAFIPPLRSPGEQARARRIRTWVASVIVALVLTGGGVAAFLWLER